MKMKFKKYLSDTSGNIAIMSAFATPVMLILIGVAVTFTQADNKKITLQGHADLMSLAIAKLEAVNDTRGAEQYFAEYTTSQLPANESCEYQVRQNPVTAVVTCLGSLDSFMAGFLTKKMIDYSVASTATTSVAKPHEVSFVFDVSDSMVGLEIFDLQESLKSLSESDLFEADDSRISFIPFANTVRLDDRIESFVSPGTGYARSGGVYNGCFDREMTDPSVNLKTNPDFPLVNSALPNGRVVCPHERMTAVFQKRTDDWGIQDLITNDLELSFGTGLTDALVWGFRSLDPDMRGILSSDTRYPLPTSNNSSKHLILMTDGRPYDRPWTGPGGGAVTQALSLARFEAACEALDFEAKNINFHFINYSNQNISNQHREIYENCVSGEGQFHNVAAGNLEEIINQIATEASPLRISN